MAEASNDEESANRSRARSPSTAAASTTSATTFGRTRTRKRVESRYDHHVQEEAIAAERDAILKLRDEGKIPDEIFRKVQYDLDLASSRLV